MIKFFFILLIFSQLFISRALKAETLLGKIISLTGSKIKIDGRRAEKNSPVMIGTIITSEKGNNRAEILIDQMHLFLTAGRVSFNKDMTKIGKKKGRHLKLTVEQGILCMIAPHIPKDTKVRIKSGPHEIYMTDPHSKISFKFCVERENDKTLLYWSDGTAMLQKIKPQKLSFPIVANSSQQWTDKAKSPENFELSLPKKQRFMDLLEITETIKK